MISQTVSHYRIINKLGAGGMGEVYLAEDTKLHRKVAIKFLPTQTASDERARKRLLREAQAAATLDHPNICSIYEVTELADQTFIVMQYLEGETLAGKIQKGPLPLTESLGLAVQIADALADAHAHGIIHRDIKPENVMCTRRGEAKVMDFGLAKTVQDENSSASQVPTKSLLTEHGTVVGTLLYMSPEQVKGENLDARSDIFSLGSLMYEMFSGKRPFASTNSASTISAILTHQPPPLTRYSDVPAELQRIVSKCLEKNKERRYSSAREVLIDLRNLASDSQQGKVETAAAPVGRIRPRWIYIAAGLVLIVALTAAVYLLQQRRARSQIHSVAVLPFTNPGSDSSIEFLADGLTESMINSLSKLSQLKVIARTTAFRYKGKEIDPQLVGKELQVDAIITGRVTKQGDTLIIQTDLLNASDGSQIWGRRYSRKASDIFAVQEQMANEISDALPLTPTGQEKVGISKRYTNNIDAYQNYLQGQRFAQLRTQDGLTKAIGYYEKAIQSDDSYALAYAGLSGAYTQMVARLYIRPSEGRRKAGEAAIKALSLDPNLAEAHEAIGVIGVFFVPHDFPTADRELRRAIELSPNLATAYQYLGISLMEQGRLDDGLAELLKARDLDPLSPSIARSAATPYYLKRDSARALAELKNSFDLGPPFVVSVEVGMFVQSGHFDEAFRLLDEAKQERPNDPFLIFSRGVVFAAQGRRAEALQVINELPSLSVSDTGYPSQIARIYATLKEKDLALEWLDRALQEEAITIFYKDDPFWDSIRSDKRFDELLRKMGIPVN